MSCSKCPGILGGVLHKHNFPSHVHITMLIPPEYEVSISKREISQPVVIIAPAFIFILLMFLIWYFSRRAHKRLFSLFKTPKRNGELSQPRLITTNPNIPGHLSRAVVDSSNRNQNGTYNGTENGFQNGSTPTTGTPQNGMDNENSTTPNRTLRPSQVVQSLLRPDVPSPAPPYYPSGTPSEPPPAYTR